MMSLSQPQQIEEMLTELDKNNISSHLLDDYHVSGMFFTSSYLMSHHFC